MYTRFDQTIINKSDLSYFNTNYVKEYDRNSYLKSFQFIEPEVPKPKPIIINPILQKNYDYIKDNGLFNVNPSVLHFRGFSVDCYHEKQVEIVNKSSDTQRCRIISPETLYFKLEYDKSLILVPGAILKLTVSFTPNEIRYYYDCIKIQCSNDRNLIVPIHAYQTAAITTFPSLIDFKAVSIGDIKRKVYSLECEAQTDFEFTITYIQPHTSFIVEPLSGIIPAGGKADINICYKPYEYSTICMKFQININQFFAKPIVCTVTGHSKPGIKREILVNNELETLKEKSKTLNPLIASKKFKPRKTKSAGQNENKNVNGNVRNAVISTVPKQLRVVRQPDEVLNAVCDFDLMSVNVWNKRYALLWKFRNAARKVIKKNRLLKILEKLKVERVENENLSNNAAKLCTDKEAKFKNFAKIDSKCGANDEAKLEPKDQPDKCANAYCKDAIDRKIFSLYTPALKNEVDYIVDRDYIVNVEHKFKDSLFYSPLKVGMQYKILGYQHATKIGSLTSLFKLRQLKSKSENANNNSSCPTASTKACSNKKQNILSIQMPPNLYKDINYPTGFVLNPEPTLTVYNNPMPWSEFDPEFHVNPLPQFVCRQDAALCTSQKKFLDANDYIVGIAKWRSLNSSSLAVLTNMPTWLDSSAPPKCSYKKVDVSFMESE